MKKIAKYVMEAENAEGARGKRKNLFICFKEKGNKTPFFIANS